MKLEEIYDPEENTPNDKSLDTSNIILRMPKKEPKLDIDLERMRKENDQKNKEKVKGLNKKMEELLIFQKENLQQNSPFCRNEVLLNKLLYKMKDSLLSSIIVYYDEIFDLMMDKILEEEALIFLYLTFYDKICKFFQG